MNIVRWNPFRDLDDLIDRLPRLAGRPAPRADGECDHLMPPDWVPPVDVVETPEAYILQAELPEVSGRDVKVSVQDGVLRLEGERRRRTPDPDARLHRVERAYGCFVRSFVLPDDVEEGGLEATFRDGVLTVRMPKSEQARPRTIEVKAAA
jgi:HSP20 family protein